MPSLTSNLYTFGDFRLDPQERVLRRGEEPIMLTPKAFGALVLLIQHSGEVITKDELMKAVWPGSFVGESNLAQTVFMLRKALGKTADQRYILTIQGRGYRFAADVKDLSEKGHAGRNPSASAKADSSLSLGQALVSHPGRGRPRLDNLLGEPGYC